MTKTKLNSQKKILMITGDFNRQSGVERVMLNLGNELYKKGHEVHILTNDPIKSKTPTPNNIYMHEIKLPNLIYKFLRGKPVLHQLYKILRVIAFKYQFKRLICNTHQFDLILSEFKVPKFVFPKKTQNNLYLWLHTDENIRKNTALKRLLFAKRFTGHKIIIVSDGLREFLTKCNVKAKMIHTIYNPFDTKEIKKLSKEANSKIPKEPYIIHAGRFCSQKRQDRLLKTFKKLKTPCKLVLLTKHDDSLTHLIKENGLENKVIIAGFQSNPYPWFKCAKLSVLCSDFEAFGMVIVESLICGCPVVSTDCRSGPNEILVGDLAKWLVPMNNDEDKLTNNLAAKIDEALNTKIKIDPSVFQRFDADKITDEYLRLINNA